MKSEKLKSILEEKALLGDIDPNTSSHEKYKLVSPDLPCVEVSHNNQTYYIPKEIYDENISIGKKHILVIGDEVRMYDDNEILLLIELEEKLRLKNDNKKN